MKNNENTKENSPKIKPLRLFCNRFAYGGLTLIAISAGIHFCVVNAGRTETFLCSIIETVLSTLGVALVVGAVFDLAKNSEEFVDCISKILSQIVISKAFLKTLNAESKREALELVLQPTGEQLQQYGNIDYYFQKKIDETSHIFNTNFKSHLSLRVKIVNDNNVVKAISRLQYRIYKINNEYENIQTWFEKEDSKILSVKLICGHEEKEITSNEQKTIEYNDKDRTQIPYKKSYIEVPEEFQSEPYITIQYLIEETGSDHWINYIWTSLTPYDGVIFCLECEEGLSIKEHFLFDHGEGYSVDIENDKKSISITSTTWLNSFTGFLVTVGSDKE